MNEPSISSDCDIIWCTIIDSKFPVVKLFLSHRASLSNDITNSVLQKLSYKLKVKLNTGWKMTP